MVSRRKQLPPLSLSLASEGEGRMRSDRDKWGANQVDRERGMMRSKESTANVEREREFSEGEEKN